MSENDAKVESIKSQIPDNVYDFLRTSYEVWVMDYYENKEDPHLHWDAFVDFVNDEITDGCAGYLGDEDERVGKDTSILEVTEKTISESLRLFKEFPKSYLDNLILTTN